MASEAFFCRHDSYLKTHFNNFDAMLEQSNPQCFLLVGTGLV